VPKLDYFLVAYCTRPDVVKYFVVKYRSDAIAPKPLMQSHRRWTVSLEPAVASYNYSNSNSNDDNF